MFIHVQRFPNNMSNESNKKKKDKKWNKTKNVCCFPLAVAGAGAVTCWIEIFPYNASISTQKNVLRTHSILNYQKYLVRFPSYKVTTISTTKNKSNTNKAHTTHRIEIKDRTTKNNIRKSIIYMTIVIGSVKFEFKQSNSIVLYTSEAAATTTTATNVFVHLLLSFFHIHPHFLSVKCKSYKATR